jgi:hypothetical protein
MKIRSLALAKLLSWVQFHTPFGKLLYVEMCPEPGVIKEVMRKSTVLKIKAAQYFMNKELMKHMSIDGENNTVYLYRDDFITDELISKLQDELAHTGLKIEIVYQPIEEK